MFSVYLLRAVKKKQCCDSSGRISIILDFWRIGIILAYTDRHTGSAEPDPYPFQPNEKLNYPFPEIYDTYETDEKAKTMLTGTAL
jgi:hypothetical protein